ncbi:uncharacterized protein TrAFT101_004252 [Trichoderma asperellum]|uniref:uncharacterized protein n=1 Tax=Trichoderma asperellum TaxID=101201 RepID=UPI0033287DF7|nr:hypothetical protein TrAFT101_004252 [Trichoderma asperellum]
MNGIVTTPVTEFQFGLLTLDTAMQTAARGPETALKPVRETTTYAINLIQSLYPLIMSMKTSLQILRQAGY